MLTISIEADPLQGENESMNLLLVEASQENSDEVLANREYRDLLNWALERLDAEERTLISMIYFDDRPLREVAKVMGWSLVNTKVRALRARTALRKIFKSSREKLS